MAGSLSDFAENELLDHVMGKGSYTMPATVAVALCVSGGTLNDASTGSSITEPTYTGYARKVIAASDLNAASGGSMTNANDIVFDACTSGSDTIVGVAICDNSTTGAGNMLAWSDVASKTIDTSNTPATIAAGALTITLT